MSIKLGIDFGTTYTYVYKEENGTIEQFGRGSIYEGTAGIPTAIGKLYDDNFVIGIDAIHVSGKGELKGILHRDLKQKLRNCYKESDDDIDEDEIEDAKKWVSNFFVTLFSHGIIKSNVDRIICGMPAVTLVNEDDGTDPITYSGCMRDILQSIFPNANITCIAEPVLAGEGLGVIQRNSYSGNVLVVDLGGGTNDYTVVQITESGSKVVVPSIGGNGPGGTKIDQCICDGVAHHTQGSVAGGLSSIRLAKEEVFKFPYDDNYGDAMLEASGQPVRLSYSGKASVSSYHEIDLSYDVELAGSGGLFDDVAKKVEKYWREQILPRNIHIDNVFFVGGGARIYPLRKAIIDKINNIDSTYQYSCDFIGESLNEAPRGEIRVNCSNIVALGAVHYEGGVEKPLGYRFGFNKMTTCNIDFMKSEDLAPDIENGYACLVQLDYAIEQDDNGKYTITAQLYNNDESPLFSEPRIWNNRRYKRVYFHFRNEQGKRFPKGNFSISLDKPEMGINGKLVLIFCYTDQSNFYAWFFPKGEEETPLLRTKRNAITLYGLNGRINKEYTDLRKIMEDYKNGRI